MSVLVGRYRFVAPLGRGGMGTVWRAVDELLQQEVAVKEVRLPADLDERARAELSERTLREARAAARLRSHPSIVTVHDVIVENDRPWIIMELVKGRSLDQLVKEGGPLPPSRVASIGLSLLDALSAAHSLGILHRDVKPANVLLTDDGRVVLTDFGIATVAGDTSLTQAGHVAGSPGYIAPERLRGEGERPESDVWSLAATLYAAVEGRAPFARDNQAAIMAAVLMHEPQPMRNAGPLTPVLERLLEKDPAHRLPAAHAMEQLRVIATGTGQTTLSMPERPAPQLPAPPQQFEPTQPSPPMQQVGPAKRSGPPWALITLGAVLALAVAGGTGFLLLNQGEHDSPHRPPPSTAPAAAIFSQDPTACHLLTLQQAARLMGVSSTPKQRFAAQNSCAWATGTGSVSINLTSYRLSTTALAETTFKTNVKIIQDEPKSNPGTVTGAPSLGDEAYGSTGRLNNVGLSAHIFKTHVVVRKANDILDLQYLGPRSGFKPADNIMKQILSNLGPPA